MMTRETARLIIRNFGADDWQDLQEMIVKYQETEYAKYEPTWPTASQDIKGIVKWFADGDSYLAVCLKVTGKLIGFIAIDRRDNDEGRVHNLGYIFHPDYAGQGYATEGCRTVMRYLFDELTADGILTGTHPANEPSVRLLKKLRLNEINQGEFSLSREEWLAHHKAFT